MPSTRSKHRYADFAELRSMCARLDEDWLTASEREELSRYRDAGRRESWLLGRSLSKRLIVDQCFADGLELAAIEILSRDADGKSVRPRVRVRGTVLPWCLSISHSDRAVLVALSKTAGIRVGVDLSPLVEFKRGFLETWFTESEQKQLHAAGVQQMAAFWGVKEAVYKACNDAESFTPGRIEVFQAESAACERLRAQSLHNVFDVRFPQPQAHSGSAGSGRFCSSYNGTDLGGACHIRTWHVDGHVAVVVELVLPEEQEDESVPDGNRMRGPSGITEEDHRQTLSDGITRIGRRRSTNSPV